MMCPICRREYSGQGYKVTMNLRCGETVLNLEEGFCSEVCGARFSEMAVDIIEKNLKVEGIRHGS